MISEDREAEDTLLPLTLFFVCLSSYQQEYKREMQERHGWIEDRGIEFGEYFCNSTGTVHTSILSGYY